MDETKVRLYETVLLAWKSILLMLGMLMLRISIKHPGFKLTFRGLILGRRRVP